MDVQSRLRQLGYALGTDGVDGFFGEDTEAAVLLFQQNSGLVADGILAENTWCELVEARIEPGERLLYLRIPPFRGADVLMLQRSLNRLGFNAGPEDGIFGPITERAVLDFQRNAGLVMDGMVDESVLKEMARVTKDGEPHAVDGKIPDRNSGHPGGKSLNQLTVAIDPGHGGEDEGACSVAGLKEKDLNLAASLMLADALRKLGSEVVLIREEDIRIPLYERPAIANVGGADIFLSIHHGYGSSRLAEGAAGYYFCRQGYYSEAGRMLAGQIVGRLALELGVPEVPVMGRNYAILRETEMTAVMIEPSIITAEDCVAASIEDYPDRVAEAIFLGLQEYFSHKSLSQELGPIP